MKTDEAKFEVGRVYMARSWSDAECIYQFKIVRRTAKTIVFTHNNVAFRRYLQTLDGSEICLPFGRYANCPVIYARGRPL